MGGAKGGRKSKRVSAKARKALKAARSARKPKAGAGVMPAAATSSSATDVSRELEASPGADNSAEMGMGIS